MKKQLFIITLGVSALTGCASTGMIDKEALDKELSVLSQKDVDRMVTHELAQSTGEIKKSLNVLVKIKNNELMPDNRENPVVASYLNKQPPMTTQHPSSMSARHPSSMPSQQPISMPSQQPISMPSQQPMQMSAQQPISGIEVFDKQVELEWKNAAAQSLVKNIADSIGFVFENQVDTPVMLSLKADSISLKEIISTINKQMNVAVVTVSLQNKTIYFKAK